MAHKHDHDTAKKVAVGGIIAGTFGFLAGILAAPKSGKETRQDIKDTASKSVSEAEKDLGKLQDELNDLIDQAKANKTKLSKAAQAEYAELVDKAQASRKKASEVLSAVRDGEAEDRDLEKAVKAANKSLDHLKKYLKK